MVKLRVTLKQCTPMIHFQSEQYGATLRATEFKPKLDKFLIKYAFEKQFDNYKHYLIGYKNGKIQKDFEYKEAFNYKLRICNVINLRHPSQIEYLNNSTGKEQNFPLYFGNMGNDKNKNENNHNKNKFVFCDTLDLKFFSFYKEIIDKIIKFLPDFLMNTNFGQRQSKGFGSFYINDLNEYFYNENKKKYSEDEVKKFYKLKYNFEVNTTSDDKRIKDKDEKYREQYSLFKKINGFYVSLRAETTKQDPYIKEYALMNEMTWNKDIIKSKYDNSKVELNYPAYLIKDLLGLSVREEWYKQGFTITKTHTNGEIERFQSPIFFKPIKKSQNKFIVYFEGRDIPKEFLNQTFNIKKDGSGDLQLKTPENFNIDDFIQYVIKNNKDKSLKIELS